MTKVGKKYKEAKKLLQENSYELEQAVKLVQEVSYSKFDWSIEIAVKTFANPKYNDQNIRSTVVLPHGTGKSQKIAAFVTDENIEDAKKAGADIAGYETVLNDIKEGKINFDVLLTTPDLMRDLAPIAKVLWPKGLMPSPKAGTVTANIKQAVEEIKKWRLEFKLDKTGNIHAIIGKVSFDTDKLIENAQSFIKTLEDNKPSGVKGKLIKKIVLSPSMGPGVTVTY